MGKPRTRALNKLTDTGVRNLKKVGRHADGGGLYLNVASSGSKSWLFMWVKDGKRTELGLGGYPAISLANARTKAANFRELLATGKDPKTERDREAEPRFAECVEKFIASIETEWRNEKHRYQWGQTLGESYCAHLRPKRVSQITTDDVLKVLSPIWTEKSETASRLRGRIERVLEYAKVKGWRSGENPAAWRGNLRNLLPKRQKLLRGHQAAMPYEDVPAFISRLRTAPGMAARVLEFTILTAARSGETLGAKWSEFDLDKKVWTVPAQRMKSGEIHKVPLSDRAVTIVVQLQAHCRSDYVFSGEPRRGIREDLKHGRPMSNMAMMMLVRRMEVEGITIHGFRSAFRDWCGDATDFARELAEAALAHKIGNEVERAYRRRNALEKRAALMQAWAEYLGDTFQNIGR